MMMNVLALSLILTTLATAGVLSPPPEKKQEDDDVILVKDGHRVVIVEYEKDHGRNTKVSISPHEESSSSEKAGEKTDNDGGSYYGWSTPKELVCDAFGKCKHKIAGAFERTKDTAAEKAYEAAEKAYNVEEGARGSVSEGLGKVRDTVVDKGRKAVEAAEKAYEVEEGARGAISEGLGKVRDKVVNKGKNAASNIYEIEEGARDTLTNQLGKVRASVEEKAETAKETAKYASRKMENMKDKVSDKANEAKDSVKENIVRAFGMANLIGLAIAYGMCVWVTFISSYVLARTLPRQQFATVQSKIYPVYFKAMAYSIGAAFLGHLLSQRQRMHSKGVEQFLGFNLLFSLVMVLVNLFYLEPRTTKVIFERMKMEKEEGGGKGSTIHTEHDGDRVTDAGISDHPTGGDATEKAEKRQQEREKEAEKSSEMVRLSRMLKKLNSYSSFLNVVTLMSLTFYLADLGQRLHIAC